MIYISGCLVENASVAVVGAERGMGEPDISPSVFYHLFPFSAIFHSALPPNWSPHTNIKYINCHALKNNISYCIIKKDIVCPEAVKIDDLDPAAVSANYDAAKSKASSAEAGSPEAAEAMIEVEVNRAMGSALGLSLA